MANKLPKKLNKEPLIDAVFEVRFSSKVPVSVILPGILFNSLGTKNIEPLPISQLPKTVRDADLNLKYAPLSRIDWTDFFINISDFSLGISCKFPYPGWSIFKPAIIKIMGILTQSGIVEGVERYSMKYVDMIPCVDIQQKVAMINFAVSIADHQLKKEQFHIRIEIPRDHFVHAVQVISSAHAVLHNGTTRDGLVVDVDTFIAQNGIPMKSMNDNLPDALEAIHLENKTMFFSCLTPHAVDSLEPSYE